MTLNGPFDEDLLNLGIGCKRTENIVKRGGGP